MEFELRRVACRTCGAVKRERLDFLADNPRYTKRFAFYVGRRCRSSAIKDIAEELQLEWHTVKTLEQQYMREQLRRAGTPGPKVIGIDEVSLRRRALPARGAGPTAAADGGVDQQAPRGGGSYRARGDRLMTAAHCW